MSNFWLILLIFGGVASFSRKNEKRSGVPTPETGENEQDVQTEWERKIRELLGEGDPVTTPQPENNTPKQSVNPTHSTQTSLANERKGSYTPIAPQQIRVARGKKQPTSTILAKSKTSDQYKDKIKEGEIGSNDEIKAILDDFSMEKAVIYSEILKPKYEEL